MENSLEQIIKKYSSYSELAPFDFFDFSPEFLENEIRVKNTIHCYYDSIKSKNFLISFDQMNMYEKEEYLAKCFELVKHSLDLMEYYENNKNTLTNNDGLVLNESINNKEKIIEKKASDMLTDIFNTSKDDKKIRDIKKGGVLYREAVFYIPNIKDLLRYFKQIRNRGNYLLFRVATSKMYIRESFYLKKCELMDRVALIDKSESESFGTSNSIEKTVALDTLEISKNFKKLNKYEKKKTLDKLTNKLKEEKRDFFYIVCYNVHN